MKLSCLPVSFFQDIIGGRITIGQWAQLAADFGLDGIDLSILFFKNQSREYLQAVRQEIESVRRHDNRRMTVAVINTYPDLTHPDPRERKRQLRELEKAIEAAAVLGGEMVRVTAGQAHPGIKRDEGVKWAVEGLYRALHTAQREGIRLVFENHSKPGVWQYQDFSLSGAIFLEITDSLKKTPMGILFDTANPLVNNEEPLPLLEKVIDRVCCIHAADIHERGTLKPVLIGTGIVPFREIFGLLKRSGYQGWISIEEASGLGPEGVAAAAAFIRNTWSEVSD